MAASGAADPADPLSHRFWEDPGPRVLLPPGDALAADGPDWAGLGLPDDAVVFSSSGTTGQPKLLVQTRRALLASARMVAGWLGLDARDHFFCPLPLHHVGGFGLVARARVTGAGLAIFAGKWNAGRFVREAAGTGATVTSLVPSQIFDLVRAGLTCPPALRLVVVGGGRLSGDLESEARQLGWPILASFGMTEAASQIATEIPGLRPPGPGWLPVMDGWELALTDDDRLRLRGEALFSGRVLFDGGRWIHEPPEMEDGWFTTADMADLKTRDGRVWLLPRGRTDDAIKIRGELIFFSHAEAEIEGLACGHGVDPATVALIDIEDARTGRLLVLAGVAARAADLPVLRDAFNRRAPAFARIERLVTVPEIPRSVLGKLQRGRLREMIARLP